MRELATLLQNGVDGEKKRQTTTWVKFHEIKHGGTLATLRISITYRTVTGNARKFDELSSGHPLDP